MSDIDWSKAPEGYDVHIDWGDRQYFYRVEGDRYVRDGCFYAYITETAALEGVVVNRRPMVWNGEGLPPVGTVCDCRVIAGAEWTRCEIVAHKYHDGNAYAIAFVDENTVMLSCGIRFRPIRTPEQIAAEDREKAIEEMWAVYWKPEVETAMEGLGLLYDAGYRKVEVKP